MLDAITHGFAHIFILVIAGKNDKYGIVPFFLYFSDQLKPAHPWHFDIGDDNIRHLFIYPIQRFESVLGSSD
ncbi:hypothetical protein D3C73_1624280 [compost metagenome]